MKELSIEEKAKRYDEAINMVKNIKTGKCETTFMFTEGLFEYVFPELEESEDEKIRKAAIEFVRQNKSFNYNLGISKEQVISWLEKQGDTNETINRDKFAQGVLRGAAINLITWIDYNAAGGNMCLSNMECKDIEDALVSGDWDKIYGYIKKKLEKQGESKFEQCIQEGDKIVTNEDGTHFNVSQLERVAKKKPKKISSFCREHCKGYQETGKCFVDGECQAKKNAELYWSEEDENKVTLFMQLTEGCDNEDELADWLKSLKERMKGE